ncbi:MAG: Trm112 family protein, partial [Vicinamibacterales bacterium]
MRPDTLDILRCPFCGGRLDLVTSLFHTRSGDEIVDGLLGCQCCLFPVVDGIPVMHLQPNANAARAHLEAGRPALALRAMVGLEQEAAAERFEAAIASPTATYRGVVDALGPGFEGGYFLYRFSDPTFIVSQAVVRAVAGAVLHGSRRAIDVCGGSGHLTRTLLDLSSPAPVLADLYFPKVWLARRFTAPGCEPVCCDGNGPFPFARGAFAYAMCSDAFMFIWTKRLFIGEMTRLVA